MTDGGTVTHNGIDINTAGDKVTEVVQTPIQVWLHHSKCNWLNAGIPFPQHSGCEGSVGRGHSVPLNATAAWGWELAPHSLPAQVC